jgi:signal transduction histidine kinase/ActR/RegA family two-component response regulator
MKIIYSRFKRSFDSAEQHIITFGIMIILGFIGFYFLNTNQSSEYEDVALRTVAAVLAIPLILKNYWPTKIKYLQPLYWYMVLLYTLPFFFSFMLLKNQHSTIWITNCLTSLVILALLVDWLIYFALLFLGIATGWLAFIYTTSDHTFIIPTAQILGSYIPPIIYLIVFSHKKDSIYWENKIRLALKDLETTQLEQKVAERTAELETALKIKTDILNNVSHEVRTPISGITSMSQGIVDDWDKLDNDKRKAYAIQVAECGRRLFSLMSNLLDLSKISAGKMVMDMQPANIKELVDEMIDECKMLYLNDSEITIAFKVVGNANLQTVADKDRLVQVLRNLFANAIKFTKRKNPKSILHARLSESDGNILFELIDEGPGIPAGELESIFEPFVQSTRTNTGAGGTGLGLSISKEIIEAHGGKIWAENNPEVGAKFSFTIPIIGVCDNSQPSSIQAQIKANKELTIMIIDDEQSCHGSLDLLLSYLDAKIINYYSGIDALEYLNSHPHDVDLILLDLMMPDMHGMGVLKTIRGNPILAHLKVIVQSGSHDPEDMRMALELGSIGYVSKPYNKDNLMKCVEKAISTPN